MAFPEKLNSPVNSTSGGLFCGFGCIFSRKDSKYCKTCYKIAGVGKSAAVIIKGCYSLLCEVAEYLCMCGIHQLEANRTVTLAPIHGPEQGQVMQAAHQPHWQ